MNSSFDKRKKYSNKEINMINEYEKLNMMVKEDMTLLCGTKLKVVGIHEITDQHVLFAA